MKRDLLDSSRLISSWTAEAWLVSGTAVALRGAMERAWCAQLPPQWGRRGANAHYVTLLVKAAQTSLYNDGHEL